MKASEDIRPVTYLKTRSAELIERVTTQRRPIIITQNGQAKVVVQDIRSFERDRDALLMMRILSQGIEDVKGRRVVKQEAMMKRLEKKLRTDSFS